MIDSKKSETSPYDLRCLVCGRKLQHSVFRQRIRHLKCEAKIKKETKK